MEDIEIDDFRAQVDTNFWTSYMSRKRCSLSYVSKVSAIFFRSLCSVEDWAALAVCLSTFYMGCCGFSSVLSSEVKWLGVDITVLAPGGVKTDWTGSFMKMSRNEVSVPEKVAKIVVN
ncbi:hypothetical protein CEP54_016185 [Fusarium duplospermum]|uniref:Uncharacterized protein n=1 Tax=Fusarium duplospermum TaxID=1325734 RepID=A0A428NH50_9HYPO|nr:hypothetical protein CEP54_016185 [Fusarium duplospermum]